MTTVALNDVTVRHSQETGLQNCGDLEIKRSSSFTD